MNVNKVKNSIDKNSCGVYICNLVNIKSVIAFSTRNLRHPEHIMVHTFGLRDKPQLLN